MNLILFKLDEVNSDSTVNLKWNDRRSIHIQKVLKLVKVPPGDLPSGLEKTQCKVGVIDRPGVFPAR